MNTCICKLLIQKIVFFFNKKHLEMICPALDTRWNNFLEIDNYNILLIEIKLFIN
jgi:hypothetical protein